MYKYIFVIDSWVYLFIVVTNTDINTYVQNNVWCGSYWHDSLICVKYDKYTSRYKI